MVTNRNAVNLLVSMREHPGLHNYDRLLAVTTLSFDIAALELFLPIITGAQIISASRDVVMDGQLLYRLMTESGATVMQATPHTWRLLLEAGWRNASGLKILCGGEALPSELANELISRGALWNMYGPTETTIWSATSEIKVAEATIPIGQPIANTRIYILDSRGEPVPIGITGEIHIGGEEVARGYLDRTGLTADQFIVDPFTEEAGARMYKTGDLGRWLADGTIEFLGRTDEQVKIRGVRIELGEIEARLVEHSGVREAVVTAREQGSGEKRLVAYYTVARGDGVVAEASAERLRAHLQARLPEYMVPAAYVELDGFPLTSNGKLDRRSLPAPEADAYGARGYEAPVGETETWLAELWSELLSVEKVGRQDNFFELGGHSLLAMRLISRLRQTLGVEVAVNELFANPVPRDFARVVEGAARTAQPEITLAERGAPLPLSFAQQRLWFLAQLEGASQAYHIPWGMRLRGELDRGALARALDRIVERHEALRTTFVLVGGERRS